MFDRIKTRSSLFKRTKIIDKEGKYCLFWRQWEGDSNKRVSWRNWL